MDGWSGQMADCFCETDACFCQMDACFREMDGLSGTDSLQIALAAVGLGL